MMEIPLYVYVVVWVSAGDMHCIKTYIPTTWEFIGYADGNVY